jgi:hypothetical protein
MLQTQIEAVEAVETIEQVQEEKVVELSLTELQWVGGGIGACFL